MKCICGNNMIFKSGNITIGDILVKNVPHYYCDDCLEISFDIRAKVITVVNKAIKENKKEIDFSDS